MKIPSSAVSIDWRDKQASHNPLAPRQFHCHASRQVLIIKCVRQCPKTTQIASDVNQGSLRVITDHFVGSDVSRGIKG